MDRMRGTRTWIILLLFGVTCSMETFASRHHCTTAFVTTRGTLPNRRPPQALHASRRTDATESPSRIPEHLVQSLDLAPLVWNLADYAGTRRGREALLGLIGEEKAAARPALWLDTESAKRRRVIDGYATRRSPDVSKSRQSLAPIASCANDARREYKLVEQASLALSEEHGVSYPPLYGATSSPWDVDSVADTDHDDWLRLPSEEWTLEHVLQADQVIETLLRVQEWSNRTETQTWLPDLSSIAQKIATEKLQPIHDEIRGSVEIVRVRSAADPKGRSSFKFRLNEKKFPQLQYFREREGELSNIIEKEIDAVLRKLKGSPEVLEHQGRTVICIPKGQASAEVGVIRGTTDNGKRCLVEPHSITTSGEELIVVRNELSNMEDEIERGMMRKIQKISSVIDQGIHILARLDVIFSKAALGTVLNGAIPKVLEEGQVNVESFVHPVLAIREGVSVETPLSENVVPIDLLLSHDEGSRALIISGANGGGKTVALKSFGVASLMAKLALPVPQSLQSSNEAVPRVDYFDNVLVEVGDQQSVLEGESTLMARLNAFSSVIESVNGEEDGSLVDESHFFLVLMDELGAGTDPTAGGAISQAVLEKLLESEKCHIVATTHSPRLKALSYNDPHFHCATVLLRNGGHDDYKRPSYKLKYGSIGDSYALGAASRSSPPLPEDVLSRAASLMASASSGQEAEDADYLRAMTASLDRELEVTTKMKSSLEISSTEIRKCRNAMVKLAETYANHLVGVEDRLQRLYRDLRDDEARDTLEVVGDTVETVSLARKKLKTEEEMLKERGLKKVPIDYQLNEGESVVIIANDDKFGGTSATVVQPQPELLGLLEQSDVVVMPSAVATGKWNDPFFLGDDESVDGGLRSEPLIIQRSDLAIWDMDGVWEDVNMSEPQIVSVRESRQRLSNLLSTLNTSRKQGTKQKSQGNSFKSARARKAAKAKGKK